jgi:vacuolar-type H+-ATPase subunit H
MENGIELSPEELALALEKAKREAQALLDKMTPEEREQARIKAEKLIEEDNASMQKLIDDAKRVASEFSEKKAPSFCTGCGAPAGKGNFCEYCGQPLK